MILRPLLAALAVSAAGVAALAAGTSGLGAFTTESARRLAVAAAPLALPDAVLEDPSGARFRLRDFRGRPVLVEFFYARCPTVCTEATAAFGQLRDALDPSGDDGPLLVSISFDPAHDGRATLADYARAFGADGRGWRFARPTDAEELRRLLAVFGVIAIPDGAGGFVHNAAIHLLDRAGRLARIYDLAETEAAARAARAPP